MAVMGWTLTAVEYGELWRRWKAGEPVRSISDALGRPYHLLYHLIRIRGGVAPVLPLRAERTLSLVDP